MTDLAILGGNPEISEPLTPYASIGQSEKDAVAKVMDDGCLSGFFGSWRKEFLGGPRVREFEEKWGDCFGAKHVVSVNSNTSGLIAAMGAIGISPGDEVIVPPTTMSATAMAPLFYGGVPIFADMSDDDFGLDPAAVLNKITDRTRAVLVVNLFGHPAKLHELLEICNARGIYLIEDNAQGPLASENGKNCGTIGHIGIFSLNYHKHIHTGEGGMCTTEDDELAKRMQMIRNHAEAVAEYMEENDFTNLVGMNLRLTELSAAIGLAQLKEVDRHVGDRIQLAQGMTEKLSGLDGITMPVVRKDCKHVYYHWMTKFDAEVVGVSRERFNEALVAEGFPSFTGYVRPIYHMPVFKKRIAIGRHGFPFTLNETSYENAQAECPVAEKMYNEQFLGVGICDFAVEKDLVQRLANAFLKVYENRHLL